MRFHPHLLISLLVVLLLALAGCGQPTISQSENDSTQAVQEAVGTGIALTYTAEQVESASHVDQTRVFLNAVDTAVAQTEESLSAIATRVSGTETARAPTATVHPTATRSPTPTILPTSTAAPKPTATQQATVQQPTAAPAGSIVYDAYQTIQALASLNDSQIVYCRTFVDKYNHLGGLPESIADVAVYAWARSHVLETSRDEKLNCDAYLAGANTDNFIPFIQWGLSRRGTDEALQALRPVVVSLGFTP